MKKRNDKELRHPSGGMTPDANAAPDTEASDASEFTFIETAPDTEAEKEISAALDATLDAQKQSDTGEDTSDFAQEDTPTEQPPTADDAPASAARSIFRICMPLAVICIAAALMLAVVNALTADIIERNNAAEKENAVLALFPDAEGARLYGETDGMEIYYAYRDGTLLGCCVGLSENGFGGAIRMMVALQPDGSPGGVRILSMSETPGVGSRTNSDTFLSRFRGSGPFEIGRNIDAVSGATISSRAIVRGVNRALAAMPDFSAIAAEAQLSIPDVPEEGSDDPQNPALTAPPAADESAPETAPVSPAETDETESDTPSITIPASILPQVTPIVRSSSINRVKVTSAETIRVSETDSPEETEPPVTDSPAETEAPVTELPTETEPPVTEIPAETEPPVTELPTETEPPVTDSPTETEPPVTELPAETEPPVTEIPDETETPVTDSPTETETPVTELPAETEAPATELPAETEAPVTELPTETEPPVTELPAETEAPV
ncbi:MAG: FMN-binding protein [Eubacteriales bacterium]